MPLLTHTLPFSSRSPFASQAATLIHQKSQGSRAASKTDLFVIVCDNSPSCPLASSGDHQTLNATLNNAIHDMSPFVKVCAAGWLFDAAASYKKDLGFDEYPPVAEGSKLLWDITRSIV